VALEHLATHDRTVDDAVAIDADAFRARMIATGRFQILDERGNPPVFRAADANALLDPEQFVRASVGP